MAALSQALAQDGLWLLLLGVTLAGLVRGFTGFGTAMVYMPFAAQVLPPVWVLVTLIVIDILGPLPAVPRALRDGHPRDVMRLGAGALIGVPLGVMVLTALEPQVFRYAVSVVAALLLVLLIGGFRYNGPVGRPLIYGTGGIAGFLGGAVGLGGPPVILLYMARPLPVATIRANIMLFLIVSDILMLAVFLAGGLLHPSALALGAVLVLPYLVSVWIGSAIFDPARERVYRWTAYIIIAGSVISGLPVWD
jgi:uncharacterized membrane protein YfcA